MAKKLLEKIRYILELVKKNPKLVLVCLFSTLLFIMFETPVLLLIFNRPALTREVFDTIRQQKPKFLFVAADGPRPDRKDDIEKCKATREIINPDWDCELYTLYRDENLGCGRGPAEVISWFFNHVEQGIILEDEVIPSMSFSRYCSELLEIYRDEQRVFMISGINLLSPWKAEESSYTFAYLGGIPAWAPWKRAWDKFD